MSGNNIIPPHTPSSKPASIARFSPAAPTATGDLIDFGEDDSTAAAPPKRDSSDITGMLRDTGKDKNADGGGPLIDFTGDIKKELPTDQGGGGGNKNKVPSLKKSGTESSGGDAFFDAQE